MTVTTVQIRRQCLPAKARHLMLAVCALTWACDSVPAPIDFGELPFAPGYAADWATSTCRDVAPQWRRSGPEAMSAAAQPALGRSFYLRPTGDDAAAGDRPDTAWRSLARASQQVLQPGDRVLLEAGASFAGTLRLDPEDSGTANAPVMIGSFGDGRARIEAATGTAIEIASASFIVVRDLELHGDFDSTAQSGNSGSGLRAENTLGGGTRLRGLYFTGLDVSGFRDAGIAIAASPPDGSKGSGYEDVEIAHSVAHDNGDVGVATAGPYSLGAGYSHRGVLIHHVRAHHNRGLLRKGEHTGSGIVLADVDGGAIERCVAHDNGEFNDHRAGGGFGIWAWDSNAIVIQHNESYANKSQTVDGGGFDLDGGVTHSALQYNYSHDNHGAGLGAFQFAHARPHGANVIRYNISQNDGAGLLLWDGNGDLLGLAIHNNVVVGPRPALTTYSRVDGVRALANVFYTTGSSLLDIAHAGELILQGNAYFSASAPFHIAWNRDRSDAAEYHSLADFRAATGHEQRDGQATGLDADPRLLAPGSAPTQGDPDHLSSLEAYQLQDDSPLIDKSVDLGRYDLEPGCVDFFGNPVPRGEALDIGAHERR